MKKIIALTLALVLVLSLCACGAKENLVGTWKANIELAEAFNEEMAAAGMGDFINLESFALPLVMTFNEDGTGSMTVDQEAMTATIDKLAADLTAGLEAYFTEYFASMGIEMDLDEALAASGLSMDDLVDEFKAEFAGEEAFAEFTNEFKYKAEDGKLYMSEDLDSEISDTYNTYELKGNTLTLNIGTEELDEEMAKYLFPMTLTRAK